MSNPSKKYHYNKAKKILIEKHQTQTKKCLNLIVSIHLPQLEVTKSSMKRKKK